MKCGSQARCGGFAALVLAAAAGRLTPVALLPAASSVAFAARTNAAPQTPAAAEEKNEERPWSATIAPAGEPGQRLVVSGTVRAADGKTPLAGVDLYVYHTDAAGLYNRDSRDSRNPRLQAHLRTRADGRYEFRSIKPGPYPQGGAAAHIHFVLSQPGHDEQYFEIFFAGDPYLDERTQSLSKTARVCKIVSPTQDETGTLQASCDITYFEVEPSEAAGEKR